MRKAFLWSVLSTTCLSAAAQEPLDSLRYILPEFKAGIVVYTDNHYGRGMVNISPLDQQVYCISDRGDTLVVEDNSSISKASMGGRTFFKWNNSFVEIVHSHGELGIGVIRSTAKVDNAKIGAFGTVDRLSSIETYSHNESSGTFRTSIIDNPLNYVYVLTPCLCKGGRYYDVTRKSFQKLFPSKKDYIESVWRERKMDVKNMDEVKAFFDELSRED